jgi:hypothetical protein
VKTCGKCKQELSFDNFSKQTKSTDGYQHYCRPCQNAINRKHRKDKIDDYRPKWRKVQLSRIGWTEELFESTLEKQNSCCAICGSSKPGGRWNRFFADHNHETGKARGLLCFHCNTALGVVEAKGADIWMNQVKKYLEDNN